jgi:hypothetical protein
MVGTKREYAVASICGSALVPGAVADGADGGVAGDDAGEGDGFFLGEGER